MSTVTFSSFVYEEAIGTLFATMDERSSDVLKTDNDHFAFKAWKAYIFSVLALESIINEFLVMNARFLLAGNHFPVQDIQDLELRRKYVLVPLLFGVNTFDKGRLPFQDFDCLVRLRNDLVHYRMRDHKHVGRPAYFERLKAVNALLVPEGDSETVWLHDVSTFRGALWACRTMHEMREAFCDLFSDHNSGEELCRFLRSYNSFPEIGEEYASLCRKYPATPDARSRE